MRTPVFVVLATMATTLVSIPVAADKIRYEAVWHSGEATSLATAPLSRHRFIETGASLVDQGLRLVDVETMILNGHRAYAGLWTEGSDGNNIFDGPMGPVDLRNVMEERRDQGMRLIDFEIFRAGNGGRRYIGVWASGSGTELLTGPMGQDAFFARTERLKAEGLRLIDVEIEEVGSRLLYSGLFRTGSGSNFLTASQSRSKFVDLRDQMVADGLELVDVERVRLNDKEHFVGVWTSGHGESRLSRPRSFGKFFAFAQSQLNDGNRTQDIELRVTKTQSGGEGNDGGSFPGGSSGGATTADLPDLPAWIQLSGGDNLVLDFSTIIDNHPRLTLPTSTNIGPLNHLPPFLPRDDEGNLIIPDNFCGIKVKKAASFQWQKGGQTITDFPYGRVDDVAALPGEADFLGGIEFTGPIGACEGENDSWQFFQPLTQTGGDSPVSGMKLVIQMRSESEIEFLNFNIHHDAPLEAHELFSDEVFETLEEISKTFESLGVDNGFCSIDQYVKQVCEESPSKCPVGNDFQSPC